MKRKKNLTNKTLFGLGYLIAIGLLTSSLLNFTLPAQENPDNDDHLFTTPDNLKDNVEFWKKIYTEITLTEGFIHDNQYPMIIYKYVAVGDRKGRIRRQFIQEHLKEVIYFLENLSKKQPYEWNDREKEIADLFEKYASIDEIYTAAERVRFQLGQKDRFKEGLERSGAYMPYIQSILKKYGIPSRIAFLPHVESSFNINAMSSVGAAGMWQFMRSTARIFQLKVDYRIDERKDPFKSSDAAARLLLQNYRKLGSWPCAITAYNHGPASIQRAITETGSTDLGIIIEKYKNRRFKFASKNFYGCFLAASEIAANPEKYFHSINYHKPIPFNTINLKNTMRPKTLAKSLGISENQLKDLNPSLRPIVFKRQLPIPAGMELHIPNSLSPNTADQAIASVPPTLKPTTPNGIHYYTVKKGDTLHAISRKFDVSVESLLINNEISGENRVYIGQVLQVPSSSPSTSPSTSQNTPNPTKTQDKPAQTTPKTFNPKPSPTPTKPSPSQTGKLEKSIDTPAANKPMNGFDANLYHLDMTFFRNQNKAQLTISVDETLGHYADWLGVPTSAIRRLNQGLRYIKVNQKIFIPVKTITALEQFNNRRLEYHMAIEEDFYSQYQVVDTKKRKVRYGETLWSICVRDEEIPLWLWKKYNPDSNLAGVDINMIITIPIIAPK